MRGKRRTSHATGLVAETLCRLLLRLKGYRILAARYRSKLGEIDIVAARGRTVALIEVKARSNFDEALQSLGGRQRARLERAACDFLAHFPQFSRHHLRFDAMLVAPGKWPKHIKDAWRPG